MYDLLMNAIATITSSGFEVRFQPVKKKSVRVSVIDHAKCLATSETIQMKKIEKYGVPYVVETLSLCHDRLIEMGKCVDL